MKKIIFAILLFISGCGPRCIRNHYEANVCYAPPAYINMGDIMVPVGGGSYECKKYVCDEYEK